MALESIGRAHWDGDLTGGSGTATLVSSGAAGPLRISWKARTEEHGGQTSPEELIAAAHASCFSMALSGRLARNGTPPESIDTEARVTFDTEGGAHIAGVHLIVRARVPGLDADAFQEAAEAAKEGCPVSKALAGNVEITLDAGLE